MGNDRPSLGARLGVGLSKPWGVWEGGFDERLGGPLAGYEDLWVSGALGLEALPISVQKPFRYQLQQRSNVSNAANLTNARTFR